MKTLTPILCLLLATLTPAAEPWPSFRGQDARGISDNAVPTTWDMKSGKNVLWKTPIPGLGLGAAVIWDDRVYLVTAVGKDANPSLKVGLYGNIGAAKDMDPHKWKLVWEKTLHEGVPAIKRHTKASHANSTPATDGKHIVVFLGSEGLHCLDRDGKLLWRKDFGVLDSGFFTVPDAQWGFGSSPIIHGDRVIIQADVQRGSFVAALRLADGEVIWKKKRDEVPTWSTPTVVETEGRKQVVVNGWKHIGGYDFATGEELWRMQGLGDIPVPTPIFGHGLIFITNAHGPGAPVYAIRPDANGDISLDEGESSNASVAWSRGSGAYMQTPLLYGDHLYVCRDNGVLTVVEARTGERTSQERLGGGSSGFTASAVAAGDHIYYTSEMGEVYVLKAGAEPELIATNDLEEISMATPALSDGTIFFRTKGHLVAIREEAAK
jgi:hypothetical protein